MDRQDRHDSWKPPAHNRLLPHPPNALSPKHKSLSLLNRLYLPWKVLEASPEPSEGRKSSSKDPPPQPLELWAGQQLGLGRPGGSGVCLGFILLCPVVPGEAGGALRAKKTSIHLVLWRQSREGL